MKIGLNLLYLIPETAGGAGTYAGCLADHFAAANSADEYILFVNREAREFIPPRHSNIRIVPCNLSGKNRLNRYLWEQAVLPFQALRYGLDLLHSLGYVGPVFSHCPRVVTVYDLNFIRFAENTPLSRRIGLSLFVRLCMRTAKKIITISQFSRDEICSHFPSAAKKVVVTYAAGWDEAPGVGPELWQELTKKLGIRGPFILTMGNRSPHKNTDLLIRSYARIQSSIPHQLVLVGQLGSGASGEHIGRLQDAGRLVITGFIPLEDLKAVVRQADLFVFPSLYEGFGLPLLDVQAQGVPVLASSIQSLREIGGDGAAYFDPTSEEELSGLILMYLNNADLRARLVSLGHANCRKFSWAKAARETMDVYRSCLRARID